MLRVSSSIFFYFLFFLKIFQKLRCGRGFLRPSRSWDPEEVFLRSGYFRKSRPDRCFINAFQKLRSERGFPRNGHFRKSRSGRGFPRSGHFRWVHSGCQVSVVYVPESGHFQISQNHHTLVCLVQHWRIDSNLINSPTQKQQLVATHSTWFFYPLIDFGN